MSVRNFHATLRATPRPDGVGCVGVDPSDALLAQWGLPISAEGAFQFGETLLTAANGVVDVVKPQVAYYERFGPDGYRALQKTLDLAREMGLLSIADAKRGDIGSTSEAYGRAWFGPDAPMRADALTVSAYLGFGAIASMLDQAAAANAYVFVVARSSNPEGAGVQAAGDPPVWIRMLDEIRDWSARHNATTVGAVVGATAPQDLALALDRLPESLFLAPGIGSQGATINDLRALDLSLDRVVVSSSRGVSAAGPELEPLRRAAKALTDG